MNPLKIFILLYAMAMPAMAADLTTEQSGGREYILASPAKEGPLPLIIALHPLGADAGFWKNPAHVDLREVADSRGAFVAMLNGTDNNGLAPGRSWNAGLCCAAAMTGNVDDIGFMNELVAGLVDSGRVDPAQVYLVGYSNGGMMTYRALCEADFQIRAALVIAGAIAKSKWNNYTTCRRQDGVSLTHIHGERDPVILAGGRSWQWLPEDSFNKIVGPYSLFGSRGGEGSFMWLDAEHDIEGINAAFLALTGGTIVDAVSAWSE